MSCAYCGGTGCPYCMPIPEQNREYYIIDPETLEAHPCTEDEYNNAVPEYREAAAW